MCSGISSPGSATIPRGNSGNSREGPSGIRPLSLRTARGDEQVVEDRRRQHRLEQSLVDALEQQVAAERVLPPQHRYVVGVRGRLERAVEPPKPVREELLAAHADVLEPGGAGEAHEIVGRKRVNV